MGQEKGLISVIVPVYNVEEVLNRCIKSIVMQTYTNLEIILVDDGSEDRSGMICDEWAEKDCRVKVIHKKNGGLSSARNYGLDLAKGNYLGFVDSDDYIALDMYESLIINMDKNIDISCCGTVSLYPERLKQHSLIYNKAPKKTVLTNGEAIKELLLLRYLSFSACNKLFKREIFNDIRFPVGKICEDLPAIYEAVKKSKNVVNIGQAKYFYCYRDDSISRKEFSKERIAFALFARDIYKDVCDLYPELKKIAEMRYIENVMFIMCQIKQSNKKEEYNKIFMRFKKLLFRRQINILSNQYFSRESKIEIIKMIWRKGA